MITKVDDLEPGQVYVAPNQGTNITPHTVTVTVKWVGEGFVHYTKDKIGNHVTHDKYLYEASVDWFLSVINQSAEDEPRKLQ